MNSTSGRTGESEAFLLRVWWDNGWRGRLLDLRSGEACDFRCWSELTAALVASLSCDEPPQEKVER